MRLIYPRHPFQSYFQFPFLRGLELKGRSVVKVVLGEVSGAEKVDITGRERPYPLIPLFCHQHVPDSCVEDLQQ